MHISKNISKNWIPKLKIKTTDNIFKHQIHRIIDDNSICFDVLDDNEEFSNDDKKMCVIISNEELSELDLDVIYHGICIFSENTNRRAIQEHENVTNYFVNELTQTELTNKLERISLKLMSLIKEKGVLNSFSKQLEEAKETIEDYGKSLEEASLLQHTIMTNYNKSIDYDIGVIYKAYRLISGDVVFVEEVQDCLFIMLADVTDHGFLSGIYGASLYTLAKNYVHNLTLNNMDLGMWVMHMYQGARLFYPPKNTKTKVKYNDLLTATATFAMIDKKKNIIDFCFCGSASESPIIVKGTGGKDSIDFFPIESTDDICPVLGNPNYKVKVLRKKFLPGSSVIFYSDGASEIFLDYADTESKDMKKIYSKESILKAIKNSFDRGINTSKEIVKAIVNDAKAYAISSDLSKNPDMPLTDDLSILCIKRSEIYI